MKSYRIEKGNLLKDRKVFRPCQTVELTDGEAATFRAGGGILSEIPVTAPDVVEEPEILAAAPPEVEETNGNDVPKDDATTTTKEGEEGEGTKARRHR